MGKELPKVAYFCMEYGLESRFKIYSGGLGILAGDYLKGAGDNSMPIVGIGIKWKRGYVDQKVIEGKVYDCHTDNEYDFLEETGVKVKVRIRQKDVYCKVWKVDCFGNAPLYLLDADIEENSDRWITAELYGGSDEDRIAQEMVLGIGGVRALKAMGIDVDIYHFNEGHAVLAGLELIRGKMERGMRFDEAWEETRQQIVFTTHTPVKAGNEQHAIETLLYMGANLGLTIENLVKIGGSPFNMTVAALRLSKKSNTVSMLHCKTANEIWKDVEGRSEIIGITNAVHKGTWAYNKIIRAFEQNEDLWAAHMDTKKEMVAFIEKRTGRSLNAENLIIGFSRRATGYKRNNLIFREEERIKGLLEEGKLQIVFSGKAHPRDCGGKDMILSIAEMEKKYPGSVVFIENYDMEVGSMLTRGCDVWLNNPRRPKEASGTSGMKAAMNGVLNCSILDGWWPEVCKHGVNGWAIGDEVVPDSEEEQDKKDLKALYRVLLEEVVPTYYNDRPKWVEMMRKSISSTIETFSMERMLKQYYELLYSVK